MKQKLQKQELGKKQYFCKILKFFLFLSFSMFVVLSSLQAQINVNTTDDENNSDGDCSLREAIISANNNSAQDACVLNGSAPYTINVPAGTYNLNVLTTNGEDAAAQGDLDLLVSMTIAGAGSGNTIIDGNATDRVFHIHNGSTVTLENMTIQNGDTQNSGEDGGGILAESSAPLTILSCVIDGNSALDRGGGLYVDGSTLNITNSTMSGNSANNRAGGLNLQDCNTTINGSTISGNICTNNRAGGMYVYAEFGDAMLTINNSTISGNTAGGSYGGGIAILGIQGRTMTSEITNSTISGNFASTNGGGILLLQGASAGTAILNLNYCTITGNTCSTNTGSNSNGGGFAIINNATATIKSCIISGNHDATDSGADDCLNNSGTFNSSGYNIIGVSGNAEGCVFSNGNQTGDATPSGAIGTVLNATLGNNGGSTQTHLLTSGSDALDIIPNGTNDCGGTVSTDQRGVTRPSNTNCDAGSVEGTINLPVEWVTFMAKSTQSEILLSWVTATEFNNDGFEVQWSISNGFNSLERWQTLDFIKGAGTAFDTRTYYFKHKNPRPGSNYYRLKQMDYDGSYKYSSVVSVDLTNHHLSNLKIFPNPVQNNQFTLYLPEIDMEQATLEIFNTVGQLVQTEVLTHSETVIRTDNLPTGMYWFSVDVNGQRSIEKVIVE